MNSFRILNSPVPWAPTHLVRLSDIAGTGVKVVAAWKGAWSGATTYAAYEIVRYLGSSYISLQASNLNFNPATETTWWGLLAEAGTDGVSSGESYLFSTSTSGDPGSGKIAGNNANVALFTQINISETDANGAGLASVLARWGESSTSGDKGILRVVLTANHLNFIEYKITAAPTDAGTYRTIPVSYLTHNVGFSPLDPVTVLFDRTGDKGADGTGTGDVVGPVDSANNELALFSGATGKLLKRPGSNPLTLGGAVNWARANNVTVAATTDIGAILGNYCNLVIGSGVTITSFGASVAQGIRIVRFYDANTTITHNSVIVLPGGANIVTTAGDIGMFAYNLDANVWNCVFYQRGGVAPYDGTSLYAYGKHTVFVAASGMSPRTGAGQAGCGALVVTNGATDQPDVPYLPFDDTVDEYARFTATMPKAWNGGVIEFEVLFKAATATTGNMVWGVRGANPNIGATLAVGFGAAGTATQAVPSTTDKYTSTGYGASFVPSGTLLGRLGLFLEVFRKPSDTTNDTATGDGHLIGVLLHYTVNASNDN